MPRLSAPALPRLSGRSLWVAGAVVTVLVLAAGIRLAFSRATPESDQPATPTIAAVAVAPAGPQAGLPAVDPGNAEEIWLRAQAQAQSGSYAQAVVLLHDLQALQPDYRQEEVSAMLGELCRAWYAETQSRLDPEVLAALTCIADVHPDDPLAASLAHWQVFLAARDRLLTGAAREAIALLEPIVARAAVDFADGRHRQSLYEAYLQQGDLDCSVEQHEAGQEWYLKALGLEPARPEALTRLAVCAPPPLTPAATPAPTFTPTPLPPGAMQAEYTQEGRFNVRMGPGLNYPIVLLVNAGATFTVMGRTDDAMWLEAQTGDDSTVWLLAELVETNYPVVAAPVVATTPAPPTDYVVADSVADFGTTQGERRWFYLASQSPGSLEYAYMPRDGGWYRWTTGGRSPLMRLSADGSHPSWNSDAMRMWLNFYQADLRIEGRAHKEPGAGSGGNGVVLRIVQRRPAQAGSEGFTRVLWEQGLGPFDTTGLTFQVAAFAAEPRDEIYFITSANGDDRLDNTVFTARILLMNAGGVSMSATPTLAPTPPPTSAPVARPTTAPAPALCFQPTLRHFEQHRGCCGEVAGLVRPSNGVIGRNWVIYIEGPPHDHQYRREFAVAADGGYEITALTAFPIDSIFYNIQLRGPNIRSGTYRVSFLGHEDKIRAVVDFEQVTCR